MGLETDYQPIWKIKQIGLPGKSNYQPKLKC
jgi:hypothetical protein